MSKVQYHSVVPENNKTSFIQYDVVDFVLSHPTRMIALNSIRFSGELAVRDTNGDRLVNQLAQFDKLTGAHSLFSGIQTFIGGRSMDNIGMEYPRLVKMLSAGSETVHDMCMGSAVCELKAPSNGLAQAALKGTTTSVALSNAVVRDPDFSVKPMIALNQVYGQRMFLSYEKTGDIRISVVLNRNESVFHGREATGLQYSISDFRCEYTTYEDDGVQEPILFKKRQVLKQSFQSQQAQLNFNYPMMADRVYGSFLEQANEANYYYNNVALEKPSNLKELTFLWQNATNQFVSYQLRSDAEIIDRAVDAIGNTGKNSCSPTNVANNDGYLIGLNLGENLDMMRTKLTVSLDTEVNSNNPMLIFMIAEGLDSY